MLWYCCGSRNPTVDAVEDGSDYRKYLPGQFIRIRLKLEQNCRLFLDIVGSAIMNDLFMTFTSMPKLDAKCVCQQ